VKEPLGRKQRTEECGIKMNLNETGWKSCGPDPSGLGQGDVQALMNAVMNFVVL
jgi:hypothetical protein